MKNHFKTILLLSLVSGQSLAGQYAIQLEASKSPHLPRFDTLHAYGSLYTEAADNGYIRTRLGPYDSKDQARETLQQIHDVGFPEAIMVKHQSGGVSQPVALKNTTQTSDIENFDVKTLKEWNMLTPEQQKNLVYLDGKLHIKDGDSFTPLAEITGQN